MSEAESTARQHEPELDTRPRPRLGFLGAGWVGQHRLQSIAAARRDEIVGLADLNPGVVAAAALEVPGVEVGESLQELLRMDLDGLVIATPTPLHAEHAKTALAANVAVFCQKPLGRTESETRDVIEAARRADRLLAVNMTYRFVRGIRKIKELITAGEIGEVYAMDLIFHNAYGPDKPWDYDPRLAGGGCVIDLGIHLIDMALWMSESSVARISSCLFAQGQAIRPQDNRLEDYATVRLDLENGASANLACSWNLPVGRDAVIRASFYGTKGGLSVRNVNGSFYDFIAEQFNGAALKTLDKPPDRWGGRAVVAWADRLAENSAFDPEVENAAEVARVIDAIYQSDR